MRERIRMSLAGTRGRSLASDPGLSRLRTATAAVVALASAIVVEYGFARLVGAASQPTVVMVLVGAVLAMMGSMALTGTGVWAKVRIAAFFPVALGLGLTAAALVQQSTALVLVGFVVTSFVAVFVRRFGIPFFFYGFMGWMGFFFGSFLKATPAMVPGLVAAAAVAAAWVLLLSVTVLRTDPARVLRATMGAFGGQVRATARACADVLESGPGNGPRQRRARRRVAVRQASVTEAALMAEAWAEERGALPEGWSAPALRRRMVDAQQAVDRIAGAARALVGGHPALVTRAIGLLDALGRENDDATRRLAHEMDAATRDACGSAAPGWWPARHLTVAVNEYLDLRALAHRPPPVDPVDSFDAAAPLMMGNLPGSPAVARNVPARGSGWNPLARLDMTTRQAVQVSLAGALAIALGWQLSPQRYSWAVITAFVTFTGTSTRSEVFIKGWNRVLGTLLGLVAAVLLARLTVGHTGWVLAVILACVFLGFYLIRVSYALMIFFVTIMVGQMYTVLGMFSDQLLVLRLEETVIGAVAGVAVALVVTPLSTRDTVRSARDALLEALAALLDDTARWLERSSDRPDLDARSRELDERARGLQLVARPLLRPLVWGNRSPRARHRLALYLATVAQARALVVELRRHTIDHPRDTATGCRALAEAARRLTEARVDRPAPATEGPLEEGDAALFADESIPTDPVLRTLARMHATLGEIAGRDEDHPDEQSRAAHRVPQPD